MLRTLNQHEDKRLLASPLKPRFLRAGTAVRKHAAAA